MKAEHWLKQATNILKEVGIGSARLDVLVLLEDELNRDRAWILAHPELIIKPEQLKKLNKKVAQRATHEPLAYIRGFTEFYGRKFKINKRVLEPRPESETMIELLRQLAIRLQVTRDSKTELTHKDCPCKDSPYETYENEQVTIADIGTGSGAIGITAALEVPKTEVDLYDIDASCLAVARHNCALHELRLHCYKRDLLNRPVRTYGVILANLPYVPLNFMINQSAAMEPRIAINGGSDGLDVYRRFFEQIKKLPRRPKYIFTESLPPQHKNLAKIAKASGYKLTETQDFIQVFEY